MLIPVPGGADGPGGVLVCAENFIIYKNQDHEEVRVTRKLWTLLVVLHWLFNANTF